MAARKSNYKRLEKHGRRNTPEYDSWRGMIARCRNPKSSGWEIYGGRGITVCEEWQQSFVAFLQHMGPRPSGSSLERIDSNGNYEPGNVRWATPPEQMRNTSRTRLITFAGKTQCIADWASELGMSHAKLTHRLNRGWSVEEAMSQRQRNEKLLVFRGETKTLRQWSEETGISRTTISRRLALGWTIEKALTTTVEKHRCSQRNAQNRG